MNSNEPITDKHEPDSHTVKMTAVYAVNKINQTPREPINLNVILNESKVFNLECSNFDTFVNICVGVTEIPDDCARQDCMYL